MESEESPREAEGTRNARGQVNPGAMWQHID